MLDVQAYELGEYENTCIESSGGGRNAEESGELRRDEGEAGWRRRPDGI